MGTGSWVRLNPVSGHLPVNCYLRLPVLRQGLPSAEITNDLPCLALHSL